MDIDGLINSRDTLQLDSNHFTIPTSTSTSNIRQHSRSASASRSNDAQTLASLAFTSISPTDADNTTFGDFDDSRKRTSQDMGDNPVARPSPPGRKRSSTTSKADAAKMSSSKDYPRRRALQACQICRARKTKCDNERPSCGSCDALGVECNYNEAPASKSVRPCQC